MRAHIGPDDLHWFQSPCRALLREIVGIDPEPDGINVRLDGPTSIQSIQRIALGDVGGDVVVGFWPAELKSQAVFVYAEGRASRMLDTARDLGWEVYASPQLAFYTSPPARRLYMHPAFGVDEYARRWAASDARWIGRHKLENLRTAVWPFLKSGGYASDEDDEAFESFLGILGKRPADLRPGLRIRKQ